MSLTKKMAVLRLNPAALREILQLPDGAEVVQVETDHDYRGLVRFVIEGVGWDVAEGGPLPSAVTGIITTEWDEHGGVKRRTVDWGFPGPLVVHDVPTQDVTLQYLRRRNRELRESGARMYRDGTAESWICSVSRTQAKRLADAAAENMATGFIGKIMYGTRRALPGELGSWECWRIIEDKDRP